MFRGGGRPSTTLDYVCCDVTALMCSDVQGRGSGSPPRDTLWSTTEKREVLSYVQRIATPVAAACSRPGGRAWMWKMERRSARRASSTRLLKTSSHALIFRPLIPASQSQRLSKVHFSSTVGHIQDRSNRGTNRVGHDTGLVCRGAQLMASATRPMRLSILGFRTSSTF